MQLSLWLDLGKEVLIDISRVLFQEYCKSLGPLTAQSRTLQRLAANLLRCIAVKYGLDFACRVGMERVGDNVRMSKELARVDRGTSY